jgi:hypothetical protein
MYDNVRNTIFIKLLYIDTKFTNKSIYLVVKTVAKSIWVFLEIPVRMHNIIISIGIIIIFKSLACV